MNYLGYTLLAMLGWGVWGFLPGLAVTRLDPISTQIWNWIGTTSVVVPCIICFKFKPDFSSNYYVYGLLAGMCGMFAGFMYNKGLSLGGADNKPTVIAISALYPVISILLTFVFLRQRINAGQVIGILLCISGAIVLAVSSNKPADPAPHAQPIATARY